MDMTLRPMTGPEYFYCYAQSQQLSSQSGLIGHLRADMDTNGKGFFSNFFDFRKNLKSDDFRADLQELIDELRSGKGEYDFLKDRDRLRAYCRKHPECDLGDGREFGLRVDTPHYSYMLRLNPNRGEYNLYCFCYVRQWLERQLKQAEKGIRFISPDYKERFRLADGDKVRIITKGGEVREMVCRYVDDYHLETSSSRGSNLYHICEFAEVWEQNGCTEMIPLRKSLPEQCFGYLKATGEIVVLQKGQKGYAPTEKFAENETPQECVDSLNAAMGVTKAQAAAMEAGSMFGWHVPGADPKNYDDNGVPLPPGDAARQRERLMPQAER